MKQFWRRLIACALTLVMVLGVLPPTAYAAVSDLVRNSAVENAALLSALKEVYGDDAEAYLAVLKQYGLVDEDGNLVTNEKIVMDGVEYTLEEIKALLDDPATDLSKVVEVDGQYLTMEDLKTIVEIEEYLAYLKATYFTEQDLTDEQIESFYSLANALANGQVKMLSSRAITGVGPAGVDHDARLTVTAPESNANIGQDYTITVTPDGNQTKDVTFSWRVVNGSAQGTGSGLVTIPAGSTAPVTLTVSDIAVSGRVKKWATNGSDSGPGKGTLVVQLYDLKNALFDNGTTRHDQVVTVTGANDFFVIIQ